MLIAPSMVTQFACGKLSNHEKTEKWEQALVARQNNYVLKETFHSFSGFTKLCYLWFLRENFESYIRIFK